MPNSTTETTPQTNGERKSSKMLSLKTLTVLIYLSHRFYSTRSSYHSQRVYWVCVKLVCEVISVFYQRILDSHTKRAIFIQNSVFEII